MTTEHSEYDRDTFEHGGIIWGAKIDASNKGKPLPWLKNDDMVFCYWDEATYGGPHPVHCVCGWGEGFQIRLPADHPYYLVPAPEHEGVMVMPRTVDEWETFAEDVPEKHWSFTLDVLDALGLILPDAPKSHVSRAHRFEQETGIRAGNEVLAALEWAANNPE